jgi:hypothetical protein
VLTDAADLVPDFREPASASADLAGEPSYDSAAESIAPAGEPPKPGPAESTPPPSPPLATPPPDPARAAVSMASSPPETTLADPGRLLFAGESAGAPMNLPGIGVPRGFDAAHLFAAHEPPVDARTPRAEASPAGTVSRSSSQRSPSGSSGGPSAGSAGAAGGTLLVLACGLALLGLGISSRLRLVPDEWQTILYLALPERPG